jgi:hypothetical protein
MKEGSKSPMVRLAPGVLPGRLPTTRNAEEKEISQSNRDNYVKTAKHNYRCGRIS